MTDYTPTDTLVTQKATHDFQPVEGRHRVVIGCQEGSLTKRVTVGGKLMSGVESVEFDGFDADGIPMAIIRVAWPEVTVAERGSK